MEKLPNIHPGEVLQEEFLLPLNISAYRLSKDINIPQARISEIIKGKRRITADTALRLSYYFGNAPKFWLGLQDDYDLEEEKGNKQQELESIKKFKKSALTVPLLQPVCIQATNPSLSNKTLPSGKDQQVNPRTNAKRRSVVRQQKKHLSTQNGIWI